MGEGGVKVLAQTVKYKVIVEKVALRTKVTINKAHTVIKSLSEVLTDAIREGNDIDCLGIFSISYKVRTNDDIYKNTVVDFDKQVNEIHLRTNMATEDVMLILDAFYRQIKLLLESGYQVNIKSIGYVEPQLKDGEIKYFSRIAPVLVKQKAMFVDFLILTDDGEVVVKQFEQNQLRFSMKLDDSLETPVDLKQSK